MKELLTKLVTAYGPSGQEQAVAKIIADWAAPFGEVQTDPLGNLIVHRPGPGKRILLAAHMDTLGLAVTYIEPESCHARFGALGGLRPAWLLGQTVRLEDGTLAVVDQEPKVKLKDLKLTDLFLDPLGAAVRPGDVAVFAGEPQFAGNLVCSPYLDNRIGCAVALGALELCAEGAATNDLYFVFTAQEEVGIRGAKTAAYAIDPELALAVDVCLAGDVPGAEQNPVKLGAGPVILYMDKSTLCHRSVVDSLLDTAKALGLSFQTHAAAAGGTDAGALHQTRGGVPTGIVSIPTRYIHSPHEVCSLVDAENCARLLAGWLEG